MPLLVAKLMAALEALRPGSKTGVLVKKPPMLMFMATTLKP